MPQGKGTYGSKVGRPPTKQKKHSAIDAIKEVDTKSTGYSNQDKSKRKTQKEIYKAKLSGNYMDLRGDKGKKSMKDDVTGTAVSKPYKMHSPLEYAPFKMKAADYGNSPMRKNFGIGDSEMPIKTASVAKFTNESAAVGDSPAKGWFKNLRQKVGGFAKKAMGMTPVGMGAKALFGKSAPAEDMGGVNAAAENAQTMAQDEQAGGEEGGGEVPPHGPEAHTGGGGMVGNMFSDVRLKEKIERTGVSASGIPIYEFNYIDSNNRYSGAMAQDLLEINPDAVTMDTSGYYKVNYNNIDVDMHLIN